MTGLFGCGQQLGRTFIEGHDGGGGVGKRKGRGRGSPHVASRLSSLSHGQAFKFPTLFARSFRWGSDVGVCPPLLLTLTPPSPNSPKWKPPPQRQPVPPGVQLRSRATSELAIAPVSPMNTDSGHEGAPLSIQDVTEKLGQIRLGIPGSEAYSAPRLSREGYEDLRDNHSDSH